MKKRLLLRYLELFFTIILTHPNRWSYEWDKINKKYQDKESGYTSLVKE